MQETWVPSLGREDSLEKGMATHFSILAWRIPWAEEPGRLQSIGPQRVRHDWAANTFTFQTWPWWPPGAMLRPFNNTESPSCLREWVGLLSVTGHSAVQPGSRSMKRSTAGEVSSLWLRSWSTYFPGKGEKKKQPSIVKRKIIRHIFSPLGKVAKNP